jgi:hypothetical protein
MKPTMKTLMLGVLVALSAATVLAQGTVNFANIQGSLNAPVYQSDGITKLSGSQYMVELLAGTSQNNLNISVATTGFLTGNGAGYFSAGSKTITGIGGGATAWVEVRFWNTANGSTFAAALAANANNSWGQSTPFSVTLGDPNGVPPSVPAALSGLAGQTLKLNTVIPEPSALALLVCGLAAVLGRKRPTLR